MRRLTDFNIPEDVRHLSLDVKSVRKAELKRAEDKEINPCN